MAIETIATDIAVFNVANELKEAGKKVSVREIAAALGGGGFNTISAALRRWKQNQELKTAEPVKLAELPAHLIDVMHSATSEIWNAAQAEAKAEIERLTIDFNARLLEAHQEREDALQELEEATQEFEELRKSQNETIKQLEAEKKGLNQLTDDMNDAIKKLQKEKEQLQEEILNAKSKKETAEAVNNELKSRVEQLSEMYKQEKEASTIVVKECRELEEKLACTKQEKAKIEGMLTVYESMLLGVSMMAMRHLYSN